MKSTITIIIGAVIAAIAILANIGTIVDNACKYLVTCGINFEAKIEVPIIICNGRTAKHPNGTIVCEPNRQPAPRSDKAPPARGSAVRPTDCPDLKPFGMKDPRPCQSAIAREVFQDNEHSGK